MVSVEDNLSHMLYSFSPCFLLKNKKPILSIYLLLLIITLSMMNSLESNLSLELFGRKTVTGHRGTLVSTALLCRMHGA